MKNTSNNSRSLLMAIFFIVIFSMLFLQTTLAIDTGLDTTAGEAGFTTQDEAGYKEPTQIIAGVVQVALGLVGTIFLVFIIVSGFQWMMAGGNAETITRAKSRIKNATIGLVLILAAYAITSFIITEISAI